MYHCHVYLYLTGQPCRELEVIRSMTPPENFTYEFRESAEFLEEEAAQRWMEIYTHGLDKKALEP